MNGAAAIFRDAYSTAGILFSGISACTSLRSIIRFIEQGAFNGLFEVFDSVFVFPLRGLLEFVGYSPTREAVAFGIFYFAFGSSTVRTFYKIYNPSSAMVIKGFWGRISKTLLLGNHVSANLFLRALYTAIIVFFWPLLVLEYSLFWRNIWHRYLDNTSPMMSVEIGTITSNARTVLELMPAAKWAGYNPRCDHNFDDDMWYRIEGNFVISFATNLSVLIAVIIIITFVSYITAS